MPPPQRELQVWRPALPGRGYSQPMLTTLRAGMLTLVAVLTLLPPCVASSADPLDELRQADFVTVQDVRATVPYGDLRIRSGVIAMFRGLDRRMAGVLVGDAEARLNRLPQDGALNQFAHSGSGSDALRFRVSYACLAASPRGEAAVQSEGRVIALRRWEGLTEREREQFASIFLQVYEQGIPAKTLEQPTGKEFFAAFWAAPQELADDAATEANIPGADMPVKEGSVRYDLRVNALGDSVSIIDYDGDVTLYAWPADAAVDA